MDSEKIDDLLKRYWSCETTVAEEQQLQAYFSEGKFPEHLQDTASLFRYFGEHRKKSIPDASFDSTLKKKLRGRGKAATLVFNTMRIAAGIVVLLVAVWLVRTELRKSSPAEMADTYDDPKLAFEETKKALMMISKSFGTAEEHAKKINVFNDAQQEVRKDEKKNEL